MAAIIWFIVFIVYANERKASSIAHDKNCEKPLKLEIELDKPLLADKKHG